MDELLLIEPDASYRAVLKALLGVVGYEAREFASIEEARPAITPGGAYRGILLSWDPADPSGLAFIRSLREDPGLKDTAVILVSGAATRAEVLVAASVGVQGILLKPELEISRLRVTLRRAMPCQTKATRATEGVIRAASGTTTTKGVHAGANEESPAASEPSPITMPEEPKPNALRELRPIIQRSTMLERLGEIEQTKAMSPTITQLMSMTRKPDCSLSAVTEVISHDQSVALKILKLANSAVFSRGEPVNSVKDAVLRIGLERIRQAAMNIGVIDQFGTTEVSARFNFMHFWEHSICCGLLASKLGEVTGALDRDQAFALGLLHDLGRMVLTESFAEEYEIVLNTAHDLDLPLEQVESRLLLLNHAAVVERLLHTWNFPKELIGPMANHHLSASNLRKHAGKQLNATAVLALANRLTHAMMIGSSGNDAIYPTEALCKLLKLKPNQVAEILETAEEETRQIKLALLMISEQQPWPAVIDHYGERLGHEFRPLYIGDDPDLDGFCIASRRLANVTDEPPNIAIVRLEAKRQVVRLGKQLSEQEEELGVGPLPTMLISPSGDIALDHTQMNQRRTVQLSTPITIRRFVRSISSLLEDEPGACEDLRAQNNPDAEAA